MDNEPQPDALLRIQIGGTSQISDDGYIEGSPELVAEISTSSATIDLGAKKMPIAGMECRSIWCGNL